MKKKQPPRGHRFYTEAGLTKTVVIHLPPEIHAKLKRLAESEERSLQITARRILEMYLERNDKK